jgi:hypothetical protein
MLKVRLKSIITVFLVITLCTCIDPYRPKLSGYPSLLVVDGLVTNENAPYEVKLSRTIQGVDEVPDKVSDAVVTISDETGKKTSLINSGDGIYKTDNNVFIGAIGKTYILDILTKDGKEYKSEPCTMLPVPEIDSLYYEKNVGFTDNQSETHEGISIYIDSKEGDETNKNYRWEYEETWKFKVPNPQKFNYINDSTILLVDSVKEFCWRKQNSSEILINSISAGQANIILKEPLCFISPDLSDRLTIQYSILAKQFSISKKESEFWANLKTVNESGGDISGSQPFPVISNISNINNPEEKVLGYFRVSAVSQKRKNITFRELAGLNLPNYHYDCVRIEKAPGDYCIGVNYCIPPTFNEMYRMWLALPNYRFIEPIYDPVTRKLLKLVFTTNVCADCEYTGTLKKPDFWIDLN